MSNYIMPAVNAVTQAISDMFNAIKDWFCRIGNGDIAATAQQMKKNQATHVSAIAQTPAPLFHGAGGKITPVQVRGKYGRKMMVQPIPNGAPYQPTKKEDNKKYAANAKPFNIGVFQTFAKKMDTLYAAIAKRYPSLEAQFDEANSVLGGIVDAYDSKNYTSQEQIGLRKLLFVEQERLIGVFMGRKDSENRVLLEGKKELDAHIVQLKEIKAVLDEIREKKAKEEKEKTEKAHIVHREKMKAVLEQVSPPVAQFLARGALDQAQDNDVLVQEATIDETAKPEVPKASSNPMKESFKTAYTSYFKEAMGAAAVQGTARQGVMTVLNTFLSKYNPQEMSSEAHAQVKKKLDDQLDALSALPHNKAGKAMALKVVIETLNKL